MTSQFLTFLLYTQALEKFKGIAVRRKPLNSSTTQSPVHTQMNNGNNNNNCNDNEMRIIFPLRSPLRSTSNLNSNFNMFSSSNAHSSPLIVEIDPVTDVAITDVAVTAVAVTDVAITDVAVTDVAVTAVAATTTTFITENLTSGIANNHVMFFC